MNAGLLPTRSAPLGEVDTSQANFKEESITEFNRSFQIAPDEQRVYMTITIFVKLSLKKSDILMEHRDDHVYVYKKNEDYFSIQFRKHIFIGKYLLPSGITHDDLKAKVKNKKFLEIRIKLPIPVSVQHLNIDMHDPFSSHIPVKYYFSPMKHKKEDDDTFAIDVNKQFDPSPDQDRNLFKKDDKFGISREGIFVQKQTSCIFQIPIGFNYTKDNIQAAVFEGVLHLHAHDPDLNKDYNRQVYLPSMMQQYRIYACFQNGVLYVFNKRKTFDELLF